MTNITNAAQLREKLTKRYDTFTLPVLDITVKYRRPDLLKLSFDKALPAALADVVIDSYKSIAGGMSESDFKKKVADTQLKADDTFLRELSTKGYDLLSKLVVSHKIMNVEESDPDNLLISWNDIPEEDSIAFLVNLLNKAQTAETQDGGEISYEEVKTFPDGRGKSKRSTVGKNG
jgi:hypothetical protein